MRHHEPHVNAWRRQHRREPGDEVERRQHDGTGAVAPRLLHDVADAAVGHPLEALLGDGRSAEVATDALEALAIAGVDDDGPLPRQG
jgi:hypothetical protein